MSKGQSSLATGIYKKEFNKRCNLKHVVVLVFLRRLLTGVLRKLALTGSNSATNPVLCSKNKRTTANRFKLHLLLNSFFVYAGCKA